MGERAGRDLTFSNSYVIQLLDFLSRDDVKVTKLRRVLFKKNWFPANHVLSTATSAQYVVVFRGLPMQQRTMLSLPTPARKLCRID